MATTYTPSIPSDILHIVFSFLDRVPELEAHDLYNQPCKYVSKALSLPGTSSSGRCWIKNASLVCWQWRMVILQLLFRHIRWRTDCITRPGPKGSIINSIPFLKFLCDHNIKEGVKSITILLHHSLGGPRESVKPPRDAHKYKTYPPGVRGAGYGETHIPKEVRDNNWLWEALFSQMNPQRITLISSPALILSLLGRSVRIRHGTVFMPEYSMFSLSRASKSDTPLCPGYPPPSRPGAPSCNLFTLRQWTTLHINEGSGAHIWNKPYSRLNTFCVSLTHVLLDTWDPSLSPLLNNLNTLAYINIHPDDPNCGRLSQFLRETHIASLYLQLAPFRSGDYYEHELFPGSVTQQNQLQTNANYTPAEILRGARRHACYVLMQVLLEGHDSLRGIICPQMGDERQWFRLFTTSWNLAASRGRLRLQHVGRGVFNVGRRVAQS